jgi:UDP-N-acetylglucosamine diphosphorylase/glucosamine-1-phosphate N-acetyltransferase
MGTVHENYGYRPRLLHRLPDLIDDVPGRITRDVEMMRDTLPRATTLGQGAIVIGEDVFCASDATIQPGAVVSSENGPVVIGAGATIGHNAVVEGPCTIGPKAVVKSMARVDGSAIGYWSKVGGEVHESVVHSLSSKGHDGYLGNSYLGRWCNLGADTNTSNLKNDYGEVTVYDRVAGDFRPSGRQFVGLFMGDHAKCSINTMFNTGSVVGVFANLFGAGFPPRHVPDFSWGGADGLVPYRLEKAFRVAEAVMARRDRPLTDADRHALEQAFAAAHPDAA